MSYLGYKDFAKQSSLDYVRTPTGLRQWWPWLIGLPLVLCLGWGLVAGVTGNRRIYEAGPVSTLKRLSASAHSDFENDCARCHTTPFRTALRFFYPPIHATPDSACITCHPNGDRDRLPSADQLQLAEWQGTPAPPHAVGIADPPCASCHREHRGKSTLTRMADAHCISCHADFPSRYPNAPSVTASVCGFLPGNHPDICWPKPAGITIRFDRSGMPIAKLPPSWPKPDPGTIRFNHKLHCEIVVPPGHGSTGPAKLTCASCHEPTRDGKHFAKIEYERHCANCHPILARVNGDPPPELALAAERHGRLPLPHRKTGEVRDTIARRLRELARTIPEPIRTPPSAERLLPGKQPSLVIASRDGWFAQQRDQAEWSVFGGGEGCLYCHRIQTPLHEKTLPVYSPSAIPERWLKRAVFDHAKHRSVEGKDIDCRVCHGLSTTADAIVLPSIGDCQKCHKPEGSPKGVASGSCITCHHYHDWRKEHRSHR